jgi:hypothetical protein
MVFYAVSSGFLADGSWSGQVEPLQTCTWQSYCSSVALVGPAGRLETGDMRIVEMGTGFFSYLGVG